MVGAQSVNRRFIGAQSHSSYFCIGTWRKQQATSRDSQPSKRCGYFPQRSNGIAIEHGVHYPQVIKYWGPKRHHPGVIPRGRGSYSTCPDAALRRYGIEVADNLSFTVVIRVGGGGGDYPRYRSWTLSITVKSPEFTHHSVNKDGKLAFSRRSRPRNKKRLQYTGCMKSIQPYCSWHWRLIRSPAYNTANKQERKQKEGEGITRQLQYKPKKTHVAIPRNLSPAAQR